MARQSLREASHLMSQTWSNILGRAAEALLRFRETRLYAQVILSVGLVGLAGLAAVLPPRVAAPVRDGLTWVTGYDYAFGAQADRAQAWITEQGGVVAAAKGLWSSGTTKVKALAGIAPPAPAETGSAGPAVVAGDTGGTKTAGPNESAPPPSRAAVPVKPVLPVDGAMLFGYGWLPPGVGERLHEGIDLVAEAGAPVVAVMDGTVLAVVEDDKHGRLVEIDHGSVIAVYAQVGGVKVHPGQHVKRGETIAAVARSTGVEESLPPHLHFEVLTPNERVTIDPALYLGLGGSGL